MTSGPFALENMLTESLDDGGELNSRSSVWDVFAAAPGRIADASTPDSGPALAAGVIADALAALAATAYRFPVSWARLQPDGQGRLVPQVLDHYDRLVDALVARDIRPWVAAYHWQLPLGLMLEGGWLVRDTAARFGEFAGRLAERLGDRVAAWLTMADPWLHLAYGHAAGVDAPGLTLLDRAAPVAAHLLVGHGLAAQALRADGRTPVGMAQHHTLVVAASAGRDDRRAARLYDAYHNRQFAEPLLAGRFPRMLEPMFGASDVELTEADWRAIRTPLDFYGVDYFGPVTVAAAPGNPTVPFSLQNPQTTVSAAGLDVDADGLTTVLTTLTRRYPDLPPLVVTDNGLALAAPLTGISEDRPRVDYLIDHLAAIRTAQGAGADVRGYFHRSLFDEWEGADGLSFGHGLTEPDGADGLRLRSSGRTFRRLAGS